MSAQSTSDDEKMKKIFDMSKYKRVVIGPIRLKEQIEQIDNKEGKYMVLKEILIRKMPSQNNRIELTLVMPDPAKIEVIEKD